MERYTLAEAVRAAGGEYCGCGADAPLPSITVDSRAVLPGSLFIPIIGERLDGHAFIDAALAAGAAAALSERPELCRENVIGVPSTLAAFQAIAKAYRDRFDIPFVGVTGSVGKTTTKELIHCVLSTRYNALKNEGNLNGQTGLPMTLLRLERRHTAAVIEMGTNHFGEIGTLSAIVRPDVCVFTNITECHIEYLGSREGILAAKCEMLANRAPNAPIIINGDDDMLVTLKGKYENLITYGMTDASDIYATDIIDLGYEGSRFTARLPDGSIEMRVPAPGRHMILNALCAAAVGRSLGVGLEEIARGVANYVPVAGRMSILRAGSVTVLNDSYNASPAAVRGAIDIAAASEGRSVLILGEMLELGENAEEYHRQIGEYAAQKGAGLLLAMGPLGRATCDGARRKGCEAQHFENKAELIAALKNHLRPGDTVLVKGSHSLRLEEVADYIVKNF